VDAFSLLNGLGELTMRAFVGVEIKEEIKNRIIDITQRLKKIDSSIKWVKSENIHITLYFLGDIKPQDQHDIEEILQSSVKEIKPFMVRVQGIGGFPTVERLRVLWVGVKNESEELGRIYRAIRKEVTERNIGENREGRGYTPHITVGRLKVRPNQKLIHEVENLSDELCGSFSIGEVVLFKSTLTSSGSIYEVLNKFSF
jgi:2'-5' RNA ligase